VATIETKHNEDTKNEDRLQDEREM